LYEILENKLILKETFMNLSRCHEALGISRSTLWKHIKNDIFIYYSIKTPKNKGSVPGGPAPCPPFWGGD
jgi:hypothetical protein